MNKTYEDRWLKDHYARNYPCQLSGYLLKDGRYIDMVEKQDVDRGAFYRDDHRTISHVYNSPKCEDGFDCMINFMKRGNIRFIPEIPGFEIVKGKTPTLKQWDAMKQLWRERRRDYEDSGKEMHFEMINEYGCILFTTPDFDIFYEFMEEHL